MFLRTRNMFSLKIYLSVVVFLRIAVLYNILLALITLVPLIVAIAFFTLAERKVMASIQRRRGPNVVGV